MSQLQESFPSNHLGAGAASTPAGEGLGEGAHPITWGRADWARPVGYFNEVHVKRQFSTVRGMSFTWELVHVPLFWLEHRAAVLLLQGQPLTALLIPNQAVRAPGGPVMQQFAHVLLRTDPWEFWGSAPQLTNLKFARLGEIPAGLSSAEVLAELAELSAR